MIAVASSPIRLQSIHKQGRASRLHIVASLLSPASVAAVLLRFPPSEYNFYPRCLIFTYFHLLCPGCGATRALAALLHGQFIQALHLNALTTLLLPAASLYYVHQFWQKRHDPFARWQNPPAFAVYCLLVITAAFTIARNLPL